MLAQLMHFKGPRSAEVLAASDRASRDRLGPTLLADPRVQEDFIAMLTLRQPDGTELKILLMRRPQGFDVVRDVVMSSRLLPGEDAALLPGPDLIDRFTVTDMIGSWESIRP